jgi:oligo-1,6-glucosidase
MNHKWWKEQVVYQVYPRSFFDANGDGIGDLKGIISKLDYLILLGIDTLWISPHFDSPNEDNGYDIRDYKKVMEEFGTMEDFDTLLESCHKNSIRLIVDLVVNHTSDEHDWFVKSRSSKMNDYRDFYIWKKGKGNDLPNNWPAFFGGSAWEKTEETGEYYLHYFSKKQPDLNWDNPKVRKSVYDLMRFWLDKGIDGFRMDVIPFISKDKRFLDLSKEELKAPEKTYTKGPNLGAYLKEMNREVLSKYDIFSVGEAFGIGRDAMMRMSDEREKELDLVFLFDIVRIGREDWYQKSWTLPQLKKLFEIQSNTDSNHWPTVFLNNHDNPRSVSNYGNTKDYRVKSAKLLALLTLTQRGTPFLYQGEEIGMTNVDFKAIDDFDDLQVRGNLSKVLKNKITKEEYLNHLNRSSRDHSRTLMQWSDQPKAGFSKNENTWFLVNPNYHEINVEKNLNDPKSVFNFYKNLLFIRKKSKELIYADYEDLDPNHPQIFCYQRLGKKQTYLVILNFSSDYVSYKIPVFNSKYRLIISNKLDKISPVKSNFIELDPWDALMFKISNLYEN